MQRMIVMCGKCGSGKSTVAKKYAEKYGYRYLSVDDVYAFYNGDECIHENKFEVWQTFYNVIHQAYKLGQSIVVDTNAPLHSDREEFLNWFPDFKEHTLIWVDAPDNVCWTNNCKRKRVIPFNQFDAINKLFIAPTADEPRGRAEWTAIYQVRNEINDLDSKRIDEIPFYKIKCKVEDYE